MCGTVNWRLTQRWLTADQELPPGDALVPRGDDRSVYRHAADVDHEVVRANILAHHQYVTIVSLSITCTYPLGD